MITYPEFLHSLDTIKDMFPDNKTSMSITPHVKMYFYKYTEIFFQLFSPPEDTFLFA